MKKSAPKKTTKIKAAEEPKTTVRILKSLPKNLKSYGGFQWLEYGHVEAPDWIETKECGNGLHGFLEGEGHGWLACWDANAKWIVVETDGPIVDLDGKVKFKSGNVIFCGDRLTATSMCRGRAVVGGTATAGDNGTATAGNNGTATAGDRGEIRIKWHDGKRYRTAVGYIGEDLLMPNVKYKINGGKFVKA